MTQLLEEDDCIVGVQYKDKETGDTKVRQFSVLIFNYCKNRVKYVQHLKSNATSELWCRNLQLPER